MKRLPLPSLAFLVLALVYVGLRLIRPVIPSSAIMLYMGFVLLGLLIHITLDDGRIRRFRDFFVPAPGESQGLRLRRYSLLLVLPLVLGWAAWGASRPSYAPPVEIFQRHPTPPETVSQIPVPDWAASPARWSREDIARGKVLYDGNCAVCHGKELDGKGSAAEGFRYPIRPANFQDPGTISQLTLRYVYWRLSSGGLQNQFNSAMPRWVAPPEAPESSTLHSYDFTPEEAWRVIMYLYDATGFEPRAE